MRAVRGRRGEARVSGDMWPGFVDALSTLVLVIIFLLVVFVLGQFFLTQLLEGRDAALERLEETVSELTESLSLERETTAELRLNLSQVAADLQAALGERDDLAGTAAAVEAERDDLIDRMTLVEDERALLARTLEEMRLENADVDERMAALEEELATLRSSVAADEETIETQLAQLIALRRDIEALRGVRDELEARVQDLVATLESERATGEDLRQQFTVARDYSQALEARLAEAEERTALAQRELEERELRIEDLLRQASRAEDAQAEAVDQVQVLNQQINALRVQLAALEEALDLERQRVEEQGTTIADLSQKLNLALAERVQELSRFRSDFFGRLRQVLGEREDVRIVGDRFVFQSEVLFPTAEAELQPGGRARLAQLADTFKEIVADIPEDLPWIIQVDGHTDIRPINTREFPSNWELSTARAISVAKFLVSQGIPADRVAAAGFGEFQPLDDRRTEEAYRRNRRIEIKLTTR